MGEERIIEGVWMRVWGGVERVRRIKNRTGKRKRNNITIKNQIKSGPHSFVAFTLAQNEKSFGNGTTAETIRLLFHGTPCISLLLRRISLTDWHCANGHTSWEIESPPPAPVV